MILDSTAWRAEWIWCSGSPTGSISSRFGGKPPADYYDKKVLFRREFSLAVLPETARLRITSNSRHNLFVNGREVLRGPIRSPAHEIHFDHLDIRDYLVVGSNCIAVLVRYYGFGTSWWEPTPLTGAAGAGALVLEASVGAEMLMTDSSWRVCDSDAWRQLRPRGELSPQVPEIFDARLLHPSWTLQGFDDSSWDAATALTTLQLGRAPSSRPPTDPFGVPLPSPLPRPDPHRRTPTSLWRVPLPERPDDPVAALQTALMQPPTTPSSAAESSEVTLPVAVVAGDCLVMDLGGIVSGILSFHLRAERGARIAVTFVEVLEPYAFDSANYIEYTARGLLDGYEAMEFMGGRYALVVPLDAAEATIDDVAVTEYLRPRPVGTGFDCDDAALNRLYAVAVRTVDLCSRDAYMDCPTREQRAWVGDSIVHQSVDLTCNSNWSLAIRNVELLGRSRRDGLLPMAAAADFADPDLVTIPDASLHWTRTVHNLYRYTADRGLIAGLMPAFESVLRWFLPFRQGDGLLHNVTGWVLIDWAPTEVEGAVAALNGLWGRALLDFAEIAEWLDDRGRAAWARAAHERLREGFEQFWDPERDIYVDSIRDGDRSRRLSEHANAAAVVGGLVPEGRHPRVAEVLLDRGRVIDPTSRIPGYVPSTFFRATLALRQEPNWDIERELVAAQPYFRYVVHDAVAALGRADALPELLRDWDVLLQSGPSALREVWRGQSYAHAWSATPARDLVRYVAGISPAMPGFGVVRIAPRLGPLRRLDTTAPSPHGLIRVAVADGSLTVESPRPVRLVRPDGSVTELPAGSSTVPWPHS